MDLRWWHQLVDWALSLPPLFVYLFALPFVVAILGLAAERTNSADRGRDA